MKNLLISLIILLVAAACSGDDPALLAPNAVPKNNFRADPAMPDAVRFGIQPPAQAAAAGATALVYDVPPGWTELPPSEFRNPNFKLDNVPGGEAYVTVLPGGGGGILPNLNRWRTTQLSLEPLTEAEMQALPHLHSLGGEGFLVDLTGDFRGMGGAVQPDYRLIGGLVMTPDGRLVTIKMTGPKDTLQNELANFKTFADSLRDAPAGAPPPMAPPPASALTTTTLPVGHPPIDAAPPIPPAPTDAEFTWTLPEGWQQGPPRQMRIATFLIGDQTEVSLIMLSGDGGGKVANIQRWFGEMGQTPPPPEEIEAMPKIEILGVPSTRVETSGNFSGMGRGDIADAALLATITEFPTQALFIKMTGPRETVLAEREAFTRFCLSLQPE